MHFSLFSCNAKIDLALATSTKDDCLLFVKDKDREVVVKLPRDVFFKDFVVVVVVDDLLMKEINGKDIIDVIYGFKKEIKEKAT